MFSSASADPPASLPAGSPDASNPFAIVLDHRPTARQRLVRALRFLFVVGVLTSIVLAATWQGKRMLVGYLARDLDRLSSDVRQERLIQLAGLGIDGLPVLARQLFSVDDGTSEASYALMRSLQDDWILTPGAQSRRHHLAMVQAMDEAIVGLVEGNRIHAGDTAGSDSVHEDQSRQRARARDLLQRTIVEFADPGDEGEPTEGSDRQENQWTRWLASWSSDRATISKSDVRRLAEATVDRLMLRGTSRVHDDSAVARVVPAARHRVLREKPSGDLGLGETTGNRPARLLSRPTQWTDWPPPADVAVPMPKLARPSWRASTETPSPMQALSGESPLASGQPEMGAPSPQGVRPVPADEAISLSPPESFAERADVRSRKPDESSIRTVANLTESPMAAMATETVLQHLGHPEPKIAQWAENELRQRGMEQTQLRFARQMVTATPADRMALVDSLMAESTENVYPWLAVALEDADRSVRLHVVSKLATIDQPQARRLLQLRLQQEDDPQVATRIRRALELR